MDNDPDEVVAWGVFRPSGKPHSTTIKCVKVQLEHISNEDFPAKVFNSKTRMNRSSMVDQQSYFIHNGTECVCSIRDMMPRIVVSVKVLLEK